MRYLLFGGDEIYYASGGAHDLIGMSNSVSELQLKTTNFIEELKLKGLKFAGRWYHIYDTETKNIIQGSARQPYGADNLKNSDDCQVIELW